MTFPGFDGSLTKEDLVLPLWNTDHYYFRTFIKNMTAVFTNFSFSVVSFSKKKKCRIDFGQHVGQNVGHIFEQSLGLFLMMCLICS